MAGTPVGFPVPQMQEGLDDREALDCFILDYIDYCTVMGWFVPKAGCKYDLSRSGSVEKFGFVYVDASRYASAEDEETNKPKQQDSWFIGHR